MEVVEKKNKNKQYKPILEGIPIGRCTSLVGTGKSSLRRWRRKPLRTLRKTGLHRSKLSTRFRRPVYREQQRMKRNRWRVDPADEPKFWSTIKNEVVALSTKPPEESEAKADEILYRHSFHVMLTK
jgi:glycerol-3-phosphate O-acyltransferase